MAELIIAFATINILLSSLLLSCFILDKLFSKSERFNRFIDRLEGKEKVSAETGISTDTKKNN